MIKKFIKISGTGKFLDYNHAAPPHNYRTTDFEKINLIYGENGSGKTTLSVILNSLKGNNALLAKKRAFDKTYPQSVEILTDATIPKLTYSNNVWDGHYENIEIFDIHFIHENIYTGLEIQASHKKNLFEIIFGQEGIALKKEIHVIKESIVEGNKMVKDTTEEIERSIDHAYTAINFCSVQLDMDIDNKTAEKEVQIETAKSFEVIKERQLLHLIQNFYIPFKIKNAKELLTQSLNTISESYLSNVTIHKTHLKMNGKEEEWLKQGYEAIEADKCPFCLRSFEEGITIIEAYKQYFNNQYNSLLQALKAIQSSILNFNLEAEFLKIDSIISINNTLLEFWRIHIPDPPVLTSINQIKVTIDDAFKKVKDVFNDKLANPIHSQDILNIEYFETVVLTLNEKIHLFNEAIYKYNRLIEILKSSNQPNLTQLESDLKKLKATKKRNEPTIASYCTKLTTNKDVVIALDKRKDEKQKELDDHSVKVFANYSSKINLYLKAFAPYLEIKGLDSGYVGSSKEPMVKYALHINGNEIMQEDNSPYATFKYSLSEGDKSALALAFFLTKLDLDSSINKKIIVFDDPVSSFDLNRKSTTISKLLDFGQKAKQLFVLTHNIIFAAEFWKSSCQINITNQCSKIDFVKNSSCIVEFFIENETMSSVLKDSIVIKNYLTNGCLSDQDRRNVARCIRPALESYFHLKFFDLVSPKEWLGDFIDKVRNSTITEAYYRLQGEVTELTDINEFSKKYHHRHNSNADCEPVNDTELRNYCDKTLKLIQRL